MAMSSMDIEKLRSDLTADAEISQQRAGSAMATRGAPEDPSYAPKSLRIKGRAIGEAELAAASQGIDELVGHLRTEAAFKDDAEANIFQAGLKKKMNQYRLLLMRQAGNFQKELAKKGLDAKKRAQMMDAFESLVSNTTSSIVMGIGNKGPGTPIADSMREPELGSQFNTPGPSLGGNFKL